jgi:hypothetical protein
LDRVSPALSIATLGGILSKKDQLPSYVGRTASSFLTQQLLRPGGVLGLCESMFGNEESSGEEVQLEKLESVAKTLISVPAKMEPKVRSMVSFPSSLVLKMSGILQHNCSKNHSTAVRKYTQFLSQNRGLYSFTNTSF